MQCDAVAGLGLKTCMIQAPYLSVYVFSLLNYKNKRDWGQTFDATVIAASTTPY